MARVFTQEQRQASTERVRRWRAVNPERSRELNRRTYEKNREKVIARSAKWAKDNPERRAELGREIARRYRAKHPEKVKAGLAKWHAENPDKNREYVNRRRGRRRSAPGWHTTEDVRARFEVHGNCCVYCGSPDDLQVDHMVPLARGGSNWPANLVPACASCNNHKHARSFTEFKEDKWRY